MNRFDLQETALPYFGTNLPNRQGKAIPQSPWPLGNGRSSLFCQRELIASRLVARRDANARIIPRLMPQRMKHVFGIRIDRTCNLFGGFPAAGTELIAHLLLKL